MTRRRKVSSGGPFEEIVGYSRAVAAGDFIFVSGCTSIVDGEVAHDGDMTKQAEQAILIAGQALAGLGASLADVVTIARAFFVSASHTDWGSGEGENPSWYFQSRTPHPQSLG